MAFWRKRRMDLVRKRRGEWRETMTTTTNETTRKDDRLIHQRGRRMEDAKILAIEESINTISGAGVFNCENSVNHAWVLLLLMPH